MISFCTKRLTLASVVIAAVLNSSCIRPLSDSSLIQRKIRHSVDKSAYLIDGRLFVQGSILPAISMMNHGVKVFEASDDMDKRLELKSFVMQMTKAHIFEIELSPPTEQAKLIRIDVGFYSRSGMERAQYELPIVPSDGKSFSHCSKVWDREGGNDYGNRSK